MHAPGDPPPIPPPEQPPEVYVQRIMDKVAREQAERARPARPPRSRWPERLLLLAAFIGLTVWNVVRARREPEVFTAAELEASARFSLYLAASAIESQWDSARTLPDSLAELDLDGAGLAYRVSDTTYVLTATAGGRVVSFRRGSDLAPFRDAFAVLTGGGAR